MYLLDTSALITPFHEGRLRALGIALGYRSTDEIQRRLIGWFTKHFQLGTLVLCDSVRREVVEKPKRPEAQMIRSLENAIRILQPTGRSVQILTEITKFVYDHYLVQDVGPFLRGADPEVVSIAKAYGATVITEEHHVLPEHDGGNDRIKGKPKLPYIAFVFQVRCVSLMTLLNELPGIKDADG